VGCSRRWPCGAARPDREFGPIVNAIDPDLRPFFARGGKLMITHGWSDTAIPPEGSVRYFESVGVRARELGLADPPIALFMVPGMGHCGGGDGPTEFDGLTALESWHEGGAGPERMLASMVGARGGIVRTRPLCAYPGVAHYLGQGDKNDAGQFECQIMREPVTASK